jgi:hypothetical protein
MLESATEHRLKRFGSEPTHSRQLSFSFDLDSARSQLNFRFTFSGGSVDGAGRTSLLVPELKTVSGPSRHDELWKHTCFEIFFGPQKQESYYEFNLAPSGDWALYAFSSYRKDMQPSEVTIAPQLQPSSGPFAWTARLIHPGLAVQPLVMSATAVLEYEGGSVEYWALKHAGSKPDFHLRESFVLLVE